MSSSRTSTGCHANQRCHPSGSLRFQRITTSLALRLDVPSRSTRRHFADLWTTSCHTHNSATPSSSHHCFYPSHCRLLDIDTSGHPCARIDSGVLQERRGRSWQSAQELFSSLGWSSYDLRARLWKRLPRTRWVLTFLVSAGRANAPGRHHVYGTRQYLIGGRIVWPGDVASRGRCVDRIH